VNDGDPLHGEPCQLRPPLGAKIEEFDRTARVLVPCLSRRDVPSRVEVECAEIALRVPAASGCLGVPRVSAIEPVGFTDSAVVALALDGRERARLIGKESVEAALLRIDAALADRLEYRSPLEPVSGGPDGSFGTQSEGRYELPERYKRR
jgi:hypothetical protein